MNASVSKELEETLNKPHLHLEWLDRFRNPENEAFFEMAFEHIKNQLSADSGSVILDCGCGTGAHSMRLARRGFNVIGIDISECALQMAQKRIVASGLEDKIKLQREDLLNLSFRDGQFDYALCWGVLMHVAEVESALRELSRVLKPGGTLVVSEINMGSAQAVLIRMAKALLGRSSKDQTRTPAGIEYWDNGPAGRLVTRHSDMTWLDETLRRSGFRIKSRRASQFTEAYTKVKGRYVRSMIHALNRFYFRFCRFPGLSLGNLVMAEKVP